MYDVTIKIFKKWIQFIRMWTNDRLLEHHRASPDSFRAEDFVTTSLAISLRDTGCYSIIPEDSGPLVCDAVAGVRTDGSAFIFTGQKGQEEFTS